MKIQGNKIIPQHPSSPKTSSGGIEEQGIKNHTADVSKREKNRSTQFNKVLCEFKEDMTSQITVLMKEIISKSEEATNKQQVELKKDKQNMNAQHRKEWETIKSSINRNPSD